MVEEDRRQGQCRWIALILVVLLFQGLLPASFTGGAAGLKTAEVFEQAGSELISRVFTLMGMILGLMVSAVIIMFLAEAIRRILARSATVRCPLSTANSPMSEAGLESNCGK